jgi:hypothetical protein
LRRASFVSGGRLDHGPPARLASADHRRKGSRAVCFVGLFGFLAPRFIIVILWLFTDYMSRAYTTWIVPTIGFFILPTTTIAYAIAKNAFSTRSGGIEAAGIVVIVFGILIDVGLIGSGRGVWKRRDPRTS